MARNRAAAIVLNSLGQLLVMYRDNHGREYYVLPGGGVDPGESPGEAVVRELREEASLDIRVKRQLYEHHYDNGDKQYFYLCEASGEPKIAADAVEIAANSQGDFHEPRWLAVEQLPATLLYPLEIRDWLIADLKNGFSKDLRLETIKLPERRQTL
jgi:8-oxo-dGTP pyrophosphatase MutT (NUDIX family)